MELGSSTIVFPILQIIISIWSPSEISLKYALPCCYDIYIYIYTGYIYYIYSQSNLNTNQISNPVVLAVNLAASYFFLYGPVSTPNMSNC